MKGKGISINHLESSVHYKLRLNFGFVIHSGDSPYSLTHKYILLQEYVLAQLF